MWSTKKKPKNFIEMVPVYEELVSPEGTIAIITENRSEVRSVRFIPPLHLGSNDFGTFRIEWKTPRYHKMNLQNV